MEAMGSSVGRWPLAVCGSSVVISMGIKSRACGVQQMCICILPLPAGSAAIATKYSFCESFQLENGSGRDSTRNGSVVRLEQEDTVFNASLLAENGEQTGSGTSVVITHMMVVKVMVAVMCRILFPEVQLPFLKDVLLSPPCATTQRCQAGHHVSHLVTVS